MSTEQVRAWPDLGIGGLVSVGTGVVGIVAELHPVNPWVRLHLLEGIKDYGTTAWFDAEMCEVIEVAL